MPDYAVQSDMSPYTRDQLVHFLGERLKADPTLTLERVRAEGAAAGFTVRRREFDEAKRAAGVRMFVAPELVAAATAAPAPMPRPAMIVAEPEVAASPAPVRPTLAEVLRAFLAKNPAATFAEARVAVRAAGLEMNRGGAFSAIRRSLGIAPMRPRRDADPVPAPPAEVRPRRLAQVKSDGVRPSTLPDIMGAIEEFKRVIEERDRLRAALEQVLRIVESAGYVR